MDRETHMFMKALLDQLKEHNTLQKERNNIEKDKVEKLFSLFTIP